MTESKHELPNAMTLTAAAYAKARAAAIKSARDRHWAARNAAIQERIATKFERR